MVMLHLLVALSLQFPLPVTALDLNSMPLVGSMLPFMESVTHKIAFMARRAHHGLLGSCPSKTITADRIATRLQREVCHQPLATRMIAERLAGHFSTEP